MTSRSGVTKRVRDEEENRIIQEGEIKLRLFEVSKEI